MFGPWSAPTNSWERGSCDSSSPSTILAMVTSVGFRPHRRSARRPLVSHLAGLDHIGAHLELDPVLASVLRIFDVDAQADVDV